VSPYDLPAAQAPGLNGVDGLWHSEQSTAPLLNQRSLGTWRVSVTDSSPGAIGNFIGFTLRLTPASGSSSCYANCDGSSTAPVLNISDFTCFLQKFASGDPYANCDGSTTQPVLNVADFNCFLQKFAAGCTG
jgi:subtilisin-like proprotein convertase family protein